MTRPGEPGYAFGQLIGAWFHQDAFEDGAESVDDILDGYLAVSSEQSVREASQDGHRLIAADLDEQALEATLDHMGLSLLPEPLGFSGHAAFVDHVVGRLDRAVAELPADAVGEDRDGDAEPVRDLTDDERGALSALLTEALGSEPGVGDEVGQLVARWARDAPARLVAGARGAACLLRDGPLLDEDLLERLRELGLGFDVVEHEGAGIDGFLDLVDQCLARALVEDPPR